MFKIELQENEREVLAVTLDKSLSDLINEIAHTDDRDYKNFLNDRKGTLVGIRKMLHLEE